MKLIKLPIKNLGVSQDIYFNPENIIAVEPSTTDPETSTAIYTVIKGLFYVSLPILETVRRLREASGS